MGVYAAVKAIPEGETRTYGEIAAQVGKTNGRGVASALKPLGFDSEVPWWRVTRADGSIGGSLADTVKVLSILAIEGVEISGGKVVR